MNRAMLVTALYRAAGSPPPLPLPPGTDVFTDVPDGQWYTQAIAWAAGKSVVNGVGSGRFDPMAGMTREQMAAVLHRYFGSPALTATPIPFFMDMDKTSAWAQDAVRCAIQNGYISGKGDGILDPLGAATRAEVATILPRYFG